MGLPYYGPDPTDPADVVPLGFADLRYAQSSQVGGGAAESIITQAQTTQCTSGTTAQLQQGTSQLTGTGHTNDGNIITVPAGVYSISHMVQFTGGTRTVGAAGVRVQGVNSGWTNDFMPAVGNPEALVWENTMTLTFDEPTRIAPIVRASASAATSLVVKNSVDSRLRILAGTNLPAAQAPVMPSDLQARFELFQLWMRDQHTITGGGVRDVTTGGVSWRAPFYTGMSGRGQYHVVNNYAIAQPANGTVITGVGGAANRTVASGYVPLSTGETLYYAPPYGSSDNSSQPGNFRVLGYASADFTVPDHWVFVARRTFNTDMAYGNAYEVLWADFQRTVPWLLATNVLRAGTAGAGGNVNMGSGSFQQIRQRVIDGYFETQFTFRWGSSASAPGGSLCFQVPFSPAGSREARGVGAFFINRSPAAEYGIWPVVLTNDTWCYFLAPFQMANCRITRAQVWDGSNGNGTTAIPQYSSSSGGNIDVSGSVINGELRFPLMAMP